MPGGGWRLTRPTGASHGSHLLGPVSAAPPGDAIRHGAALLPGGATPYPAYRASHTITPRRPGKRSATGDAIRHGAALPGGGWRLTRPTGASHRLTPRRPGKRSATGRCHRAQSRFIAGWRLAPYPAYRGLSHDHLVGPVSAAPPGDAIRHGAALCRVAAGACPAYGPACLAFPSPAGKRDCLRRWRRPAAPLAPRSGSAPPRAPPEPRWWRRSARSPLRRSATRGPLPPASPLLLRDRRGIDNSHPAWIQVLTNLASALALRQIRRLTVLTG